MNKPFMKTLGTSVVVLLVTPQGAGLRQSRT